MVAINYSIWNEQKHTTQFLFVTCVRRRMGGKRDRCGADLHLRNHIYKTCRNNLDAARFVFCFRVSRLTVEGWMQTWTDAQNACTTLPLPSIPWC